jgi:hypothetical protein
VLVVGEVGEDPDPELLELTAAGCEVSEVEVWVLKVRIITSAAAVAATARRTRRMRRAFR